MLFHFVYSFSWCMSREWTLVGTSFFFWATYINCINWETFKLKFEIFFGNLMNIYKKICVLAKQLLLLLTINKNPSKKYIHNYYNHTYETRKWKIWSGRKRLGSNVEEFVMSFEIDFIMKELFYSSIHYNFHSFLLLLQIWGT